MEITAALVKALREQTGAGMMECKKALVLTSGDMESAITELRKSGQDKAAKKCGRVAAEGVVVTRVSLDGKTAIMVEINSETDFVSRDASFKAFTDQVANILLQARPVDLKALSMTRLADSALTVDEARLALISKIGENIHIRRFVEMTSSGKMAAYVHSDRIGVLVGISGNDIELARDVAMHIAASNPQVIHPDEIAKDVLEKEKEIYLAQAQASGKSVDIAEKMVIGRLKKFLNEVSLVGQPFVKNPDITVGTLLESHKTTVTAFERFEVGEGIEKTSNNFAEEVMEQVRGA